MSDAMILLAAVKEGNSKASENLLVPVYDELRRLAASKPAHEAPDPSLQPTALVHQVRMRLVGEKTPSFKDREHFQFVFIFLLALSGRNLAIASVNPLTANPTINSKLY